MPKKTAACLLLALVLGGCGLAPQTERAARTHGFDWPQEGLRASFEYQTIQAPPSGTTCAGSVRIDNYGGRHFTVLLFNVKVYSAARELVASDRFSLSANLRPGDRAVIAADPHNPLNPVVITRRYSTCPQDMAVLDVQLEAF